MTARTLSEVNAALTLLAMRLDVYADSLADIEDRVKQLESALDQTRDELGGNTQRLEMLIHDRIAGLRADIDNATDDLWEALDTHARKHHDPAVTE